MSRVVRWVAITGAAFVIVGGALHFPGTLDNVGLEPGPLIYGGIAGLFIGAAQVFGLRGVLSRPWLWPAATAIGMAITHGMGDGVSPEAGYLPVAVVGGVATGVLQAAVLGRPLWAVATAVAFVIGMVGGYALGYQLGFSSIFPEDTTPRHAIMLALTGALYALFTAPLFASFPRKYGLPILGSDGAA